MFLCSSKNCKALLYVAEVEMQENSCGFLHVFLQ